MFYVTYWSLLEVGYDKTIMGSYRRMMKKNEFIIHGCFELVNHKTFYNFFRGTNAE